MSRTRTLWGALSALALATAGVIALPALPAQSAVGDSGSSSGAAVFATEGTGRFKDRIGWISWGAHGASLANGSSVTNWHQTGPTERLEVTCALSAVSGSLRAYRSGDWANDGLNRLYRRGEPNTHVTGIGTVNQGDDRTFRISCSSRLATYSSSAFTGAPTGTTAVPLGGLVMADAESTNDTESSWAQPVPSGSGTWHLIDRYAGTCGATYRGVRGGTSNRLTLTASAECPGSNQYSATAVAFIAGATTLDVGLNGTGLAAMSFGYMLGVDLGDAPASYGTSAAVVQPTWSGGGIGTSTTTLAGGSPITPAQIGPPLYRLGPNAFPNQTPPHSALANGDTGWAVPAASSGVTTPTPDEDAFTTANVPSEITVVPGATTSYSLANVRCAPSAGSVRGWIDWNRNGTFDSNEGSGTVACPAGGVVSLTFPIPSGIPDGVAANGDQSFVRLQFASSAAQLTSPTRTLVQGEVEDWPVRLRVPRLEITKVADVDMVPDAGDVVTYTVTMQNVGNGDYTTSTPAYAYDYYGAADDDAILGAATSSRPGTSGQDAGSRVIWWYGALDAGDDVVFTLPMTVRASPGDRHMRNTARASNTTLSMAAASASCEPGSPEAVAQTCASSDLFAVGLEVTKRAYRASDNSLIADGSELAPGTAVVWRYTVSNTGSIALSDVELTDVATDTKTDANGSVTATTSPVIACTGSPAVTPGTSVTIPTLAPGTARTCEAEGVIGGT